MNATVFVLMIVTSNGVTEAPNAFSNMTDCEKVRVRISNTYCVEKKPSNIEQDAKKFMDVFKNMVKEMEKS
jgi:hypothetical protein